MAGLCEALVVTCMDYRLHRRGDGRDFLAGLVGSLGSDCDIISRAGAAQDLVRPDGGAGEQLLRDLRISVENHGVKTIYLVNHENCGAYGGMTFASRADELAQHWQDLDDAAETLRKTFPGVEVKTLLAELADGSPDEYRLTDRPTGAGA